MEERSLASARKREKNTTAVRGGVSEQNRYSPETASSCSRKDCASASSVSVRIV
jgi:hypothetical protein